MPFLCECADENCLGRVELTPSQWEVVSAAPNHYVMIAGHPRNEADMDSLVRGVDKAETGTNGDLGLADVLSGGNGNGLEVA